MALTEAQEARLRSDIEGDAALNSLPHTTASADEICAAYNENAVPDYWVYRTMVSKEEIVGQTSQDGTTFTWAGNGFIGRTAGELTAWQELFDARGGAVNMSLVNVRQAMQDIFSGTGNAASNRTHLAVVGRRKATRYEKLFAGPPGNGSPATPATMTLEGPLSLSEADSTWSD